MVVIISKLQSVSGLGEKWQPFEFIRMTIMENIFQMFQPIYVVKILTPFPISWINATENQFENGCSF